MGMFIYGYASLEGMQASQNRGLLGITIPMDEEMKLEEMASTVRLTKTELARAMLRAGKAVFEQSPEQVLALVKVKC